MSDRPEIPREDEMELAGLDRLTGALRRPPTVAPDAVDRVVAAALARNGVRGERAERRRLAWRAAAAMLLAVGVGGVALRRGAATDADRPLATVATADSAAAPAALPPGEARFATQGAVDAPIPVSFAFSRPAARSVSLVGDFDGWSPDALPMTRDANGVWTATVSLPPGRHAYAFVVDGTAWTTDPRAPVERDPDYGRDQSIILVGQP